MTARGMQVIAIPAVLRMIGRGRDIRCVIVVMMGLTLAVRGGVILNRNLEMRGRLVSN